MKQTKMFSNIVRNQLDVGKCIKLHLIYLNFAVATVFFRVLVESAASTSSTDVTGSKWSATTTAASTDGEGGLGLDDTPFFAFCGFFAASLFPVALLGGSFSPTSSSRISRSSTAASGASASAISRIGRSFDRYSFGSGNVGRFVSLFADDDVELHDFAVSDRPDGLFGVVFDDGGLVDEDILLCVVSVKKHI